MQLLFKRNILLAGAVLSAFAFAGKILFPAAKPSQDAAPLELRFRLLINEAHNPDSIAIKGSVAPLSADKAVFLKGPDAQGFYTATLSFPDSAKGKVLTYNYQYAWNKWDVLHKITLESGATQTVTDQWGYLDGLGGKVVPAPRLAVRRANSPEEAAELAKPFVGITEDGKPMPGLYAIKKTGIPTSPIKKAVNAFLEVLTETQKTSCVFPLESEEWRKWTNIDIGLYKRTGLGFEALDVRQKDLAFAILKESLSPQGLQKSKAIMEMEEHLAFLTNDFNNFGPDKYWLTFMGAPSDTEPWGWQLDGHHLVINYFILGDQVVMTPVFMGSEPTRIETGPKKGRRTFEAEEKKGLDFYASLTPVQKSKARIWSRKDHNFIQSEAFRDNAIVPRLGLPARELTSAQKKALLELIREYVGNLRTAHANIKMAEVKAHLNETTFTWVQSDQPDGPFYYRIHSPVVLIEFDHHGPVAVWDRSKPRPGPGKSHIHTVIRTPNGNDYGKDLLKQHLEKHHKH